MNIRTITVKIYGINAWRECEQIMTGFVEYGTSLHTIFQARNILCWGVSFISYWLLSNFSSCHYGQIFS